MKNSNILYKLAFMLLILDSWYLFWTYCFIDSIKPVHNIFNHFNRETLNERSLQKLDSVSIYYIMHFIAGFLLLYSSYKLIIKLKESHDKSLKSAVKSMKDYILDNGVLASAFLLLSSLAHIILSELEGRFYNAYGENYTSMIVVIPFAVCNLMAIIGVFATKNQILKIIGILVIVFSFLFAASVFLILFISGMGTLNT